LPWVVAWGGFRSLMIAVGWRLRGIPPKRETSGSLPSRGTVTWKQIRGPSPVATRVLYLRAIFVTVEECFAARVLSMDVSMTQRRRPRRQTSWASR